MVKSQKERAQRAVTKAVSEGRLPRVASMNPVYQKMLDDAKKRRARALALKREGKTYREVGEIMGITNRQRVWDLVQRAEMEEAAAAK